MKQGNFYIFDCNDTIVGNPKGYPTIKGAIIQERKAGSKAYTAIAQAYYMREASGSQKRNLSSIRRIEA